MSTMSMIPSACTSPAPARSPASRTPKLLQQKLWAISWTSLMVAKVMYRRKRLSGESTPDAQAATHGAWRSIGPSSSLAVVSLVGAVLLVYIWMQMANELKNVTKNPAFNWWPILIPFYSMYWAWMIIPAEVAKAKQMLGVQQAPRSLVLYIFLWPFALASDLNDMVR